MARLSASLLVLLLAGSCEGYIEQARTQQLFNTPYRSEESRHFDVGPPPPPIPSLSLGEDHCSASNLAEGYRAAPIWC